MTGGGLSRSNSNPWWNKECEEAVRVKKVMHRHCSKYQNAETHERMKAAKRDCNKIIAQAKKDHWIAFADSISAGKADLGSVRKKIRRIKQQCVVPDSDLQDGSRKYTTAQSKADALAKAFAEASDTDSLSLSLSKQSFFVSASTPIAAHIPVKAREKIWANQFIEFHELLSPNPWAPSTSEMEQHTSQEPAAEKAGRQQNTKREPLTLAQWTTAWNRFTAVLTVKSPQLAPLITSNL